MRSPATALARRPAKTPLAAIRAAHHLTLEQLGRMAGVSKETVWNWERSLPLRFRQLVRIADALNVPADEILGREPVTPSLDALAQADRELLDAMRDDAVAMFGDRVLRGAAWRTLARQGWLGFLTGIRDGVRSARVPKQMQLLPSGRRDALPSTPNDWYDGWESPRQRRLASAETKLLSPPKRKRRHGKKVTP